MSDIKYLIIIIVCYETCSIQIKFNLNSCYRNIMVLYTISNQLKFNMKQAQPV